MLRAVVEDFARISGAEVRTLLRCPLPMLGGCRVECFELDAEELAFRRLVRWADFTLIIAPEFDDLLLSRCRWAEEQNGRLLGPFSPAVALTSDKWALAEHLRARRVPTPMCIALHDAPSFPKFPLVCKPRFGAGSQATFLVRDRDSLADCLLAARLEGWRGEMLVQPFLAGAAASVAFLCGPVRSVALVPAAQHISAGGRFHYQGGELPLPPPLATRAVRVAQSAIDAMPGLAGYVGVDIVLGKPPDGSDDWVIEINPRLTTSYLGLRALTKQNLAEMLVHVVGGQATEPPRWQPGMVRFLKDGTML